MGGLLHPVGPEEERTYWMRRGLVLIACLAVLAMLGFTVANMNASGVESQPAAAPAPALTVAAPVTPSSPEAAAPNGVASPTPTPVAGAPAAGAPAASAPSATASATPTASASATASAGPASPSPSATATPTPATSQRATNKPAAAAVTGPCDPKVLKTVVQGPRSIHSSAPAAFKIVVTNSGQQECVVDSDPANYEFKIYSGPARIWSTADCAKSYQPQRNVVAPGSSATWELNWDVSMSAANCKVVDERLRPGTYVATAQLKNATPAQLIMILT